MLANPALGLDLPLKASVREENGQIIVTVSDIRAITAVPMSQNPPKLSRISRAHSTPS
jgi:uncharacterized protein (DUF302 family)